MQPSLADFLRTQPESINKTQEKKRQHNNKANKLKNEKQDDHKNVELHHSKMAYLYCQTNVINKNKKSCILHIYYQFVEQQEEWLQVDFETPKLVAGVVTQGNQQDDQWLTGYRIGYSNTSSNFQLVNDIAGNNKVRKKYI